MFARTERLLLRPGWLEDAPALARAGSDESITRNLARMPWPYSVDDAAAFLERDCDRGELNLLVFRRTHGSPQLIGTAALTPQEDGSTHLGYWIARPHWGLGYATEAAGAMVEIARDALRLKRLDAAHFLDNPASGRVLRKLGFVATGAIVHRHSLGRGHSAPCRLFALDLTEAGAQRCVAVPETGCRMLAA